MNEPPSDDLLGAALANLGATITERRGADPSTSYTAKLLNAGVERCAKKFGEEAVEAALAAALGKREELVSESADVLYHLLVLWAAADVKPADVAAALEVRAGVSGLDEKAARKKGDA